MSVQILRASVFRPRSPLSDSTASSDPDTFNAFIFPEHHLIPTQVGPGARDIVSRYMPQRHPVSVIMAQGAWVASARELLPGTVYMDHLRLSIRGGVPVRDKCHITIPILAPRVIAPLGLDITPGNFMLGPDPGDPWPVQTFRAFLRGLTYNVVIWGGWHQGVPWFMHSDILDCPPPIQRVRHMHPPSIEFVWEVFAYFDRQPVPFPGGFIDQAIATFTPSVPRTFIFCQNADIRHCVVTPASGTVLNRGQDVTIEVVADPGRELTVFEIDGINYLNQPEFDHPTLQLSSPIRGRHLLDFAPGSPKADILRASNTTSRRFLYGPVTKNFCVRAHASDIIIGSTTVLAGGTFTATVRTDECCSTTWSIAAVGPFLNVSINAQGVITGTAPDLIVGQYQLLVRMTNPFTATVGVLNVDVSPHPPTGLRWEGIATPGLDTRNIISFAQDPVTHRVFFGTELNRVFSTLDLINFTEIAFAPGPHVPGLPTGGGGIHDMVCLSDGTLIVLHTQNVFRSDLFMSTAGGPLVHKLNIPNFHSMYRLGLPNDFLLYVGNGPGLVHTAPTVLLVDISNRNNFVVTRQAPMARPPGIVGRMSAILPIGPTEALFASFDNSGNTSCVHRTPDNIATNPVSQVYEAYSLKVWPYLNSLFRHDDGTYYFTNFSGAGTRIHVSRDGVMWRLAHTLLYDADHIQYAGGDVLVVARTSNISRVTNFVHITPAIVAATGLPLVTDGGVRRLFRLSNGWILAGTHGPTTTLYVSKS